MPATEKHNKDTQTAHIKEYLIQTRKPQLPFNIKNEIEKIKDISSFDRTSKE